MSRTLEIKGTLIDEKVRFDAVARDNPSVQCDFFPPIGTGQGYTGLEVLLMGLAVCSATTVVYLLRKTGREVTGCEVAAKGHTRELPEVGFDTASLHFNLSSPDLTGGDVERALETARDSACPVWQMVKGNFDVTAGYLITHG